MNDIGTSLEEIRKQHISEAREFMNKFLKATKINDFELPLENYLTDNRDGPAVCNLLYPLPNLKGMLKRDISLRYFPYSDPEGIYGDIMYRNVIISETPDILEFCNNSKILRAIIPIIGKHLGKVGGYSIPHKVLNRTRDYEAKRFKIVDHRFHTPEDRKDYCYCAAVWMSVTPEVWEMQAKAIDNIEKAIREYTNDPEKKIEELKVTKITID